MENNTNKIKQIFTQIGKRLWQDLFLFLVLLLLLDLIFGGILFLKYYLEEEEMPPTPPSLKISQTLLDNVSGIFQDKATAFEQIDQNQYSDLFR